ncbi:hypothetical protein [Gordonia polyisoprenivorans]|uniref:hypothetical protein n=1 Tax=Gordonia polyisoprenivorans TaxID=84595 RepID=UPI001AD771E7|nr:hypothetical protein [Gordonia polyisoprenivorans]QTI67283.1 hypothetical protein J6U32_16850 [Gordonia polyisoprenivorans]
MGMTGCSATNEPGDAASSTSFTLTGNPIVATPHGDPIRISNFSYPRYELHVGQPYILPGYEGEKDYVVTPKAIGEAHGRHWVDLTVAFANGDVFTFRSYQRVDSDTMSASLGGRTSILLDGTRSSAAQEVVMLGISASNSAGSVLDPNSPQRQKYVRTRSTGTQEWTLPLSRNFWAGTLNVGGDLGGDSNGDYSVFVAFNAVANRVSGPDLSLTASIECYPGDSYTVSPVGTFTLKGYTPSGEAPPTDPAKVGYSPGQMRVQLKWS